MNIMITGSSGFVGKALADFLIYQGNDVIEFDLPKHNILIEDDLYKSIQNVDIVFHCAAIANLNESEKLPDLNFAVNVIGTYNVSKVCNKLNKKLVYISTCCVYGNCKDPIQTEESHPLPTELYAHTKLAGENIVQSFLDLKWYIARIGTVFGPGMRTELFNYIAIDKIYCHDMITVHGSGTYTRNYVYIEDLVRGLYRIIFNGTVNNIYNICGFESTSVLKTIKTVEAISGIKPNIKYVKNRKGQINKENISNHKSLQIGCVYQKYYDCMIKTINWYKKCHKIS